MSPDHCETLITGGKKAGMTLTIDFAKSGGQVVLVQRGMIGRRCSRTFGLEVSR